MSQGFQTNDWKVTTNDGRNFVLLEAVNYVGKNGISYVMPVGATSDGASTPCELWPTIPPFGLYWKAAFLHDCAYRNTLQYIDGHIIGLGKDEADALLKEAMESCGVDWLMTQTIYDGVRIGGWKSFEQDRV